MIDLVRADLRRLVDRSVAPVGGGDTARRWLALYRWAREGSVSVARLAEAHLDASATLREANGMSAADAAVDDDLWGVWASAGPETGVRYDPHSRTISGRKGFCSGVGIVHRALVTASGDGNTVLVDVGAADAETLRISGDGWLTPALSDTRTAAVTFDRHPVRSLVGPPGFYLDRPGFWHNAIGPAACWAGTAAGLVDLAVDGVEPSDPYRLAAIGDLRAQTHLFETLLTAAGDATDASWDNAGDAHRRALATRHLIERAATHVADRFSQAFGPRPFVSDGTTAQRLADLHLYLRQHHGDRDLAHLATVEDGG